MTRMTHLAYVMHAVSGEIIAGGTTLMNLWETEKNSYS